MSFEHLKSDGTPTGTALAEPQERFQSFWSDKFSWGGMMPGSGQRTTAGVAVTPQSALSVTAAFCCINVIATDTAVLPLRLYRKRKDGGRDEVTDHSLSDLLKCSPDDETTSMRWRQAWVGHCLGWGNSYAEIERDKGGRVLGLHLLDPSTTHADRRPQDKKLYYRVNNGDTLPPRNVLHLAGLGFDGLTGYSPIYLAREALGLARASEISGSAFFGKGVRLSGVLESPGILKEEARKNLRDEWEQIHNGAENSWRIAILQQGTKFTPTMMPMKDAQWLEGRNFQVLEVCRMYRVPPNKAGDYSQSHHTNVEASNLDYLMTVVAPWCEQQEQIMNLRLLTPEERQRGYYVEHSMAALLRGDTKSRGDFYEKLLSLGVLTPNDICALENRNPVGTDGDKRFISIQFQPIDNAGQNNPAAPTPEVTTSNAT